MHKIANKLIETAKPMLDRIVDDTNDEISEKELDATMKIVKLACYLYEIDATKQKMMKYKMADNPDMKMDEMADNHKKSYF